MLMSILLGSLCAVSLGSPIIFQPRLFGVQDGSRRLTFDDKGAFKIVSFSDMHFGERWMNGTWTEWGEAADRKTQRVQRDILDNEKPNYVQVQVQHDGQISGLTFSVFNGDLVTGENLFAHNATKYLDQCFQPTVERSIPFSSVHGNHDNANNINHDQEIKYEQENYGHLSHTRSDVGAAPYGNGNYWVPVYPDNSSSTPAVIMWFLDSRSFVPGGPEGSTPVPPGADRTWVDEKLVPRYIRDQSDLMQEQWGHIPASLVFIHIPFHRADKLSSLPSEGNHDDEPHPDTQGTREGQYTGRDEPVFQELVELSRGGNEVLAITSGHDHGESWCARSADSLDVALCFNGHSGYGGYTTPHSRKRNGRGFQLQLGRVGRIAVAKTWNSYEDGTRGGIVSLI